jgi:hypothetical protein
MARTMDLHRVPLLAARRRDAATVKRVGSQSALRDARSRQWLLARLRHALWWRAAWLRRCADSCQASCRWPWRPRAQPIERMANTHGTAAERKARIAVLERELNGLQYVEEALVVNGSLERAMDVPPAVVLGVEVGARERASA